MFRFFELELISVQKAGITRNAEEGLSCEKKLKKLQKEITSTRSGKPKRKDTFLFS